jgi:hypothetical protein
MRLEYEYVDSQSVDGQRYRVTVVDGIPVSCPCKGWQYTKNKLPTCSHIERVWERRQQQGSAVPEGDNLAVLSVERMAIELEELSSRLRRYATGLSVAGIDAVERASIIVSEYLLGIGTIGARLADVTTNAANIEREKCSGTGTRTTL